MGEGDNQDSLTDIVNDDPYFMKNATYINESSRRWKNKQRVLIFASRGINHRHRHLMEDMKKLLPHHKSEVKWEKKEGLMDINELCEMRSCNNTMFFEARKGSELYLWLCKPPLGPSLKFQVLNIHTLGELRMSGNCILHSRPLLSFDAAFDAGEHSLNNIKRKVNNFNSSRLPLNLIKNVIIQIFGTPMYHPKSKPFYDHVFSFNYLDGKIWFRHYQISPISESDMNVVDRQVLTEIGPRFVLDPILILEGSFYGKLLYRNPDYLSPRDLRAVNSSLLAPKYENRVKSKKMRYDYQVKLNQKNESEVESILTDNLFSQITEL